MKTTLNAIRAAHPCEDGWKKLLSYLGKTQADDAPLSIATIIDSNGVCDAIWCLRAVEGRDREIRLFSIWCARRVEHLIKDKSAIAALNDAGAYANGKITRKQFNAAWFSTWGYTWEATPEADRTLAWSAVRLAVRAVKLGNERYSVWMVADSAARAAAQSTWCATTAAERLAQADELRRICKAIDAGLDPYPPKQKD